MRIIAGEFGGRTLRAARKSSMRPTTDRVKEAWMNIIQREVRHSRVVDLFAGSGALGLEALSRGAQSADFVETDRGSLDVLRANINLLGVERLCKVIPRDASRFVKKLPPGTYDIAFADPPFRTDHAQRLITVFRENPFARIFGIEHRADLALAGDRTETYGDISITFTYAP